MKADENGNPTGPANRSYRKMTRPKQSPHRLKCRYSAKAFGIAAALALFAAAAIPPLTMAEDAAARLKARITNLEEHRTLQIGDETISTSGVLPAIYQEAGFMPLWSDRDTRSQLLAEIRDIEDDGLKPADYHIHALERLNPQAGGDALPPDELVDRDLLLTDSLIRLAYHMYYGKVDPRTLHPRWRVPSYIGSRDAAKLLLEQIREGRISPFLDRLRPQHLFYRNLKSALARYRQIARRGGWAPIPEGPLIEEGMRDARVPLIRRHLLITGDLPSGLPDSGDLFDKNLQDAVILFQERHRIDLLGQAVDDVYGGVGPDTLAHLNLAVGRFIGKIRINMERARWVLRNLPPCFIVADIAGFEVLLIENNAVVWKARSQVGDVDRATPVFQSAVAYMELNPTWTVPPGILNDSILPALRKETNAPTIERFQVYDRKGRLVANPGQIDWSKYSGANLPFRLVQKPGPTNPLGRIKFIFPNPDFVFLHDTPQKQFFEYERRDLSAGCIRVEHPFDLADHLLRLDGREEETSLEQILASGKTQRINFRNPVPIILTYRTAGVSENGRVFFLDDLYSRDADLLEALDGPVLYWNMVTGE